MTRLSIYCLAATLTLAAFPAAARFVVTPSQIEDRKAVFGTVESVDLTLARSRIGGTVRTLTVDEGSAVKAGERIAEIYDEKLPLRLAALDARLASLEARRELARTDFERSKRLRAGGAASQARLDETRTRLDVVKAETAALKAERSVVAKQLEEGAVLAPASGRVLKVRVTKGSVVMPGETVAEIAADRYVLRLRLPERHARFIKVGDKVRIGSRGLEVGPRRAREGVVAQVYPEIISGRVVADVAVSDLGDFFVGERTRVWVSTGTRTAYIVPAEYVFQRFGLSYVKLEGGVEVVVQTGLANDDGIEILSGVGAGDVLVRP